MKFIIRKKYINIKSLVLFSIAKTKVENSLMSKTIRAKQRSYLLRGNGTKKYYTKKNV